LSFDKKNLPNTIGIQQLWRQPPSFMGKIIALKAFDIIYGYLKP